MESYDVIISPAAQSDFLGVAEHIRTLTPDAADMYYEQLIAELEILRTNPKSCAYAKDSLIRLRGYRMLPVTDYLFFFVLSGSTVEIRRILYAKRQYDKLA